jgi:hypothetical protein
MEVRQLRIKYFAYGSIEHGEIAGAFLRALFSYQISAS